jgi:hypothetical protein
MTDLNDKTQIEVLEETINQLRTCVVKLTLENRKLSKDASRYRWLRDCTGDHAIDEALRIVMEVPSKDWDTLIDLWLEGDS